MCGAIIVGGFFKSPPPQNKLEPELYSLLSLTAGGKSLLFNSNEPDNARLPLPTPDAPISNTEPDIGCWTENQGVSAPEAATITPLPTCPYKAPL